MALRLSESLGRKHGGSTGLQICLAITCRHAYSARHDDTDLPRRLFSCCETLGTSAEPVAVGNLSGWETGPHQARTCPFLHDDGGKTGWEALKQLLDKLLSQPQRLPAD